MKPDSIAGEAIQEKALDGALRLASANILVFPCHNAPGEARHKAPLTPRGFKDATIDRRQIEDWWRHYPDALIGIPTGAINGIAVLDLDKKNDKDGFAAVPGWECLSNRIATTGGGGAHLYFQADRPIRSTTGKNGVDVRGEGGYVIVPPSSGYSWLSGDGAIVPSALPTFPLAYLPASHVAEPSAEGLIADDPALVAAALLVIPNDDVDWDSWVRIGMAAWASTGGDDEGFEAWDEWSRKSNKYSALATEQRWRHFFRSPASQIGFGSLFYMASRADPGWLDRFERAREEVARASFAEGQAALLEMLQQGERPAFPACAPAQAAIAPENGVGAPGYDDTAPSPAASGVSIDRSSDARSKGATQLHDGARCTGEGGAGSRAAGSGAGAPGTAGGGEAKPLTLIDAGTREGEPVPDQPWVIRKLIPDRQVTLFTARGGGGKSHISFFMAGAVALGVPAFGFATTRGPAIYLTCEDDTDENNRRLIGVANALNVGLGQFRDSLFYASLVDRLDKGIARLDQNTNKLHIEPLFRELRATLLEHRAKLVILDNVAHLFEGNENIRAHVAAFLGLLNSLALEADCAIVLIGHPNKAGDSFSGSTAFQNQVRSHIHLEVDEDDPDLRKLTLAKANYARLDAPVRLRWHRGAFRLEAEVPDDDASRFSALHQKQHDLFFACLAKMTEQKQPASHSPNAGNYAPKVFATMPEAKGLKADELAQVMARLKDRGLIEVEELDFDRSGTAGHKARGLRRTNRVEEADDEPF